MKKLTAILLILVLAFTLPSTALADDGSATTKITLTVPAGSYQLWIPIDMTRNIHDVVEATEEQKIDPVAMDGNSKNYIGYVGVVLDSASNCRFITCKIAAHTITGKSGELPYSLKIDYPKGEGGMAPRAKMNLDTGYAIGFIPYYTGRYTLPKWNSKFVEDTAYGPTCNEGPMGPYGYADMWLMIGEEDIAGIEAGTYTGSLSFTFESSNVTPTDGIYR